MVKEHRTVGSVLQATWNLVQRFLDQAEGPRKFANITGNNTRIIIYLAEQQGKEVYQKDFETKFSIRRSTATRVLQLMEQKELLTREAAEHDARQRKLSLTPKAEAIYEEIVDDVKSLDRAILAGFSPEEIDTLFQLLDRIQRNVTCNAPQMPQEDISSQEGECT